MLEDTFGTDDPNTSLRQKRKGTKINLEDDSNSVGYTKITMEGVDIDYSFPKPNLNNASKRKKKQAGKFYHEQFKAPDPSNNGQGIHPKHIGTY